MPEAIVEFVRELEPKLKHLIIEGRKNPPSEPVLREIANGRADN